MSNQAELHVDHSETEITIIPVSTGVLNLVGIPIAYQNIIINISEGWVFFFGCDL